ncbi:MAG: PadR family transcriptional regulator [Lachnospiraceae bacterium]|nr:PadR family transcriptional regulator [Lachnospiraceae bacterium]
MEDTQLLKGVLEGCVLGIIRKGETYGYEILSVMEAAGFENMAEGTLYPVLTRLDKKGAIACRKEKSPLGPIRKYYSITAEGEERYQEFRKNFKQLVLNTENILDENGKGWLI